MYKEDLAIIQEELGAAKTSSLLGVSESTVFRWKNGVTIPSEEKIEKISKLRKNLGMDRKSLEKKFRDRYDVNSSPWSREDTLLLNFRLYVLESVGWNQLEAARVLGCCDRSIRMWINKYREMGYYIEKNKRENNYTEPNSFHEELERWEKFKDMSRLLKGKKDE